MLQAYVYNCHEALLPCLRLVVSSCAGRYSSFCCSVSSNPSTQLTARCRQVLKATWVALHIRLTSLSLGLLPLCHLAKLHPNNLNHHKLLFS